MFVEVGPGSILTPLIGTILDDRAHLAVACDAPGSSGLAGWLCAIARLVAAGVPLQLEPLTRAGPSASSISGTCRPATGPPDAVDLAGQWQPSTAGKRTEPKRLGQALTRPAEYGESREPSRINGFSTTKNATNGLPPFRGRRHSL